jgi:DNA-binding response OmpR family regulator
MRILIAETNLQFRVEMNRALDSAGHKIISASDGLLGWSYLTGPAPPDLLITGLELGTGAPPGTALGLRAHAQRIPVIYTPETAALAQYAHPHHGAVLTRPFHVADLLTIVRQLARERRLPPERPSGRRFGALSGFGARVRALLA